MIPTLLVGDYLFVSKYSYGYSKHSFPLSLAPFSGRVMESAPQRGDVAVFKYPGDQGEGNHRTDYIKRIIGLPGDRIFVKGGVVYINGTPVTKERDGSFVAPDEGGRPIRRYRETLPNGVSYYVLDSEPNGFYDNTREYVVPEGHYFVMGDNRDNSVDSRDQSRRGVGFVPYENLVGRAEVVFFSVDDLRLWAPWHWPFDIRWHRFFSLVR
jgi:signal peptidase I